MDKRILAVFLALICLIGIILGIRWALKPTCEQPVLVITPQNPETGEEVVFTSENGNELLWDITSEKTATGVSIHHTFSKPGTYSIKATAGEECVATQEIIVKQPCEIQNVKPELQIPATIYAGRTETLQDVTAGATHWQWTVEGNEQSSSGNAFPVLFDKPGNYTVKLALTGKCVKGETSFVIEVLKAPAQVKPVIPVAKTEVVIPPKPKPKPVVKPAVPTVSDPKFTDNFVEIANQLYDGETSSSDWAAKVVAKTCDDVRVEVFLNGAMERDVKLSKFKQQQINNDYNVSSAVVIEKGTGGCIKKIRAYVTKND